MKRDCVPCKAKEIIFFKKSVEISEEDSLKEENNTQQDSLKKCVGGGNWGLYMNMHV